jgi:hypothetical protein
VKWRYRRAHELSVEFGEELQEEELRIHIPGGASPSRLDRSQCAGRTGWRDPSRPDHSEKPVATAMIEEIGILRDPERCEVAYPPLQRGEKLMKPSRTRGGEGKRLSETRS